MMKRHRAAPRILAAALVCLLLALATAFGAFTALADTGIVLPEIPVGGERTYVATFIAGDTTVAEIEFKAGERITAPAIPEKTGYTARWENYVVEARDFTVYAIYTAKTCVYTDPATGDVFTWGYGKTPTATMPSGYLGEWVYTEADDGRMTATLALTPIVYTARVEVDGRIYEIPFTVENRDEAIKEGVEALIADSSIPSKRGYRVTYTIQSATRVAGGDVNVIITYEPIPYTITFLGANGETVATHTYTVEDTAFPQVTVPAKEGYFGSWNTSELPAELGDLTVSPVYIADEIPPVEENEGDDAYAKDRLWQVLVAAAVVLLLVLLLSRLFHRFCKKSEKKAVPAETKAPAAKPAPIAEEKAEPVVEEPVVEEPVVEEPKAEPAPEVKEEKPAAPAPKRERIVVPEGERHTAVASALSSIRTGTEADDMTTMLLLPDGRHVLIKYRKSFRARMIQSDDETKSYYSEVKNYILSFDGVAASDSWNYESFAYGRRQIAKINVSGKTIVLFLALDPATLEGSKYKYDDVGDRKRFEKTPVKLKIRSARSFKWAKELIDATMEAAERPFVALLNENFIDPYEEKEPLIARDLIQITATEVESGAKVDEEEIVNYIHEGARIEGTTLVEAIPVLADVTPEIASAMVDNTVAEAHIVHIAAKAEEQVAVKSVGKSAVGKQDIINIDVLDAAYDANDTVDIESMKAKGLIGKSVARVKVLARGHLSKPLTVIADDFSLDAVKMILLTGGTPIELD